jgi:hypothetical protein
VNECLMVIAFPLRSLSQQSCVLLFLWALCNEALACESLKSGQNFVELNRILHCLEDSIDQRIRSRIASPTPKGLGANATRCYRGLQADATYGHLNAVLQCLALKVK